MSLTMMAMRLAAVMALKSADTLVGENVLDSQISAIDQTADGRLVSPQQKPFIAVYSDTSKASNFGSTGLRSNGTVDFLFNCGVSIGMAETNKETGETHIVDFLPATDANLEAVLDILDTQIVRALTNDADPWASVFGSFVLEHVAKASVRSSNTGDGTRLAAGQMRLTVNVPADPAPNQPLPQGGHWDRFLDLMRQTGHPLLSAFEAVLGVDDSAPLKIEHVLSITTKDALSLGLLPTGGEDAGGALSEVAGKSEPVNGAL